MDQNQTEKGTSCSSLSHFDPRTSHEAVSVRIEKAVCRESADPPRGNQHDNVGLIVSCVSVIIDLHGTP